MTSDYGAAAWRLGSFTPSLVIEDVASGHGVALADEGAPVERFGVLGLHRELRLAQRFGAPLAGQQAGVEGLH